MTRSKQIKFSFLFVLSIAFLGLQQATFSQEPSEGFLVTGNIINSQGEKVVGAVILVKGTTTGTATDNSGFFTIKVPSKKSILIISHFSTSKSTEVILDGNPKVVIRLAPDSNKTKLAGVSKEVDQVFDRVEEIPRPKEGEDGWNMYLAKNAKYPANDRASGVEGTVVVSFEVYEDGSLQHIKILRGIGGESDLEVVRLIEEGPLWSPGIINGQPVKTRMSLPVRFVLATDSGTSSPKQSTEKIIADQYGKHLIVVGYQSKPPRILKTY